MKPLTPEFLEELSKTKNGFYSWDYVARLASRVIKLEAERRWIHRDKTMIVKKDGDSWHAVMPDFEDLQESESRWFNGTVNQYMDAVYGYLKEREGE